MLSTPRNTIGARLFHMLIGLAAYLSLCAVAASPLPVSAQVAPQPIANGMIVRADAGGTRVYYIDHGSRRWIVSGEAFRRQGFSWADLATVPAAVLNAVPEGEPVTETTKVVLPGEEQVLPELIPLAPYDVHFDTLNGRTILRFSATFWNRGKGPLELISQSIPGGTAEEGYLDTFQRLVRPGGKARNVLVGNFLWHELHHHYHYSDFADYVLEAIHPASGTASPVPPAITQKTTFCMRDNTLIAPTLQGASRTKKFVYCGEFRQGVSVGWADVYVSSLPDQYIDVTDLPPGTYRLAFNVDPRHHFLELDQDNNSSSALIELDVQKGVAKVIASAAAFPTADNRFPDGMLVRATGDDRVYVIRHNKKRWLRTEAIAASYGLNLADAYEFPRSVIDAIPRDAFVRLSGTGTIYRLNDSGYRRRILNPEALGSYGADATDIAEVNQAEFGAYPETDLITLSGDDRVFSTLTKRLVGRIDALPGLGRDPASVHVVNRTDFNAYVAQVVAKDLTIPWDIVFLPGGDLLVTERSGTMRRIGSHNATITLPSVLHVGEGGLMGMALHPDFAVNQYIYMYFTASDEKNRVSRFRLDGDSLVDEKVIVDDIPSALYHDGGQVAFGPDGMLYLTTGDAENPDLAQDLGSVAGKTLRFTPDGAVPADNPFGTPIWSYGHRNAQGIAWDSQGRMWQTEHGRSGALSGLDELNLIEKGKNYGWPTIQGNQTAPGMVTPALNSGSDVTWAPSGIAYVDGRLYFAGLRGSSLYEARPTETGAIADFAAHLTGRYGRLRAVVVGPDGFLYVTTSNRDGRGTPKPGDDIILQVHQDLLRAAP